MARPSNITLVQFLRQSRTRKSRSSSPARAFISATIASLLCKSVLDKELSAETKQNAPEFTVPKPSEIKRHLDRHCIGQDHAKKTLAVAVHNHFKRLTQEPPPRRAADGRVGRGPA